jgi:hypothetical protein
MKRHVLPIVSLATQRGSYIHKPRGGNKFPQWEANQHVILLAYIYLLPLVNPANISSFSLDPY